MRKSWHVAALGVSLVVLGGCPSSPRPGPVLDAGAPATSDGTVAAPPHSPHAAWPFWPRSMRVHPATRIVPDAESTQLVLETRVELADEFGDTAKGLGEVRIDLHNPGARDAEPPLATWSIDLRDLAANRLHYDVVTRTYLFRLRIDRQLAEQRLEVRVFYRGADGQLLRATHVLR